MAGVKLGYRANGWREAWVSRPMVAQCLNNALNGWREAWVSRQWLARGLNIVHNG
jgi:hypothetical protein